MSRTIREAVAIALEGVNVGDLAMFVNLAQQRDAIREHVVRWVTEYGLNRGVALERAEIEAELAAIIAELRAGGPLRGRRLEKMITYVGQPAKVACDGKCDKAWGISRRPRVYLGDGNEKGELDPDDFAYLSDHELGEAPADPGTYEGGHAKPRDANDAKHMNKWCVRECERSEMSDPGKHEHPLPDLGHRYYNKGPHRRD